MKTVKYTEEHKDIAIGFDCGNVYLNSVLLGSIALDQYYGTTYVWLSEDNKEIIGYYNIGTGSIDTVIDGTHYKSGGSFHINDFALDNSYRGIIINDNPKMTYGDLLMLDCLERISALREVVGVSYITLEATDEGHSLYERRGFMDLDEDLYFSPEKAADGCVQMYLPLAFEDI